MSESNAEFAGSIAAGSAGARSTSGAQDAPTSGGTLREGLADLLDSSARVIRSRGAAAGDSAGGAVGDAAAEQIVQTGETTATLLEHGAAWLRDADLGDLEDRVSTELREHPARTLLVAAGIGYLLSRRS